MMAVQLSPRPCEPSRASRCRQHQTPASLQVEYREHLLRTPVVMNSYTPRWGMEAVFRLDDPAGQMPGGVSV